MGVMSGFSISTPALTPLPPPGGGVARCVSQGDLLRGPEGELQVQSYTMLTPTDVHLQYSQYSEKSPSSARNTNRTK